MENFSDTGKKTSLGVILVGCLVSGGCRADSPTVFIQPVGEPALATFPKKPSEIATTTNLKGNRDEPVHKK